MAKFLITGANRGVGFELTRQLMSDSNNFVFACCRNPAMATAVSNLIARLGNGMLVEMDVADDASVQRGVGLISAETNALDVVINNAGILTRGESLASLDSSVLQHFFNVNATGPVRVAQACVDLLGNGTNPRLVNISSQLGSITALENGNWGEYSYNASKAALNVFVRMMANELKPKGITVVTMHPGWVQTDMGGPNAAITPVESAAGIINVINGLTIQDTNQFIVYNGERHPW
ncbi:MAG: SDR family oxidoreductase [Candidatus Promineifilaceae bacterium]